MEPYERDTPVSAYLDPPALLDFSRLTRLDNDAGGSRARLDPSSGDRHPRGGGTNRVGFVNRTRAITSENTARARPKPLDCAESTFTSARPTLTLRTRTPSSGVKLGHSCACATRKSSEGPLPFSSSPFFSSPCPRIFKCHPVTPASPEIADYTSLIEVNRVFCGGKLVYWKLLTTLFPFSTAVSDACKILSFLFLFLSIHICFTREKINRTGIRFSRVSRGLIDLWFDFVWHGDSILFPRRLSLPYFLEFG